MEILSLDTNLKRRKQGQRIFFQQENKNNEVNLLRSGYVAMITKHEYHTMRRYEHRTMRRYEQQLVRCVLHCAHRLADDKLSKLYCRLGWWLVSSGNQHVIDAKLQLEYARHGSLRGIQEHRRRHMELHYMQDHLEQQQQRQWKQTTPTVSKRIRKQRASDKNKLAICRNQFNSWLSWVAQKNLANVN